MPSSRFRRRLARALLLATALGGAPALAADKPATPEGAQMLQAFIAEYLPATSAATPLATVAPEGGHYLVSVDLGALNGTLAAAGAGASFDPATLVYKAVEQNDGNWRLVIDSLPKIVSRSGDTTRTLEITNYQATALIDPAIAWFLSGSGSADKGVRKVQGPKIDQTVDFGRAHDDLKTIPNADGSVSTSAVVDIADIGLKISSFDKDDAPVNLSGRLDKALINLDLDGLKTRAIFALWGLLNAHPARPDLIEHEPELKSLLTEIAAPGLKIAEGAEAQKVVINSSFGAIALANLEYQFGAANAGPQSAINLTVSASDLSLPVGLGPPGAADLTPSKIDIDAKFSGIDFSAAAKEAIADIHLQGDAPMISDSDMAKVTAALLSVGPMRLDFAPSHIVAPAIDADVAGMVRYIPGKLFGSLTIHMRNFDKTMVAIRSLGPDVEGKATPALAMAKGLAKTESDGSLTWLIELGEDRSMKVNGIPLGKAPN